MRRTLAVVLMAAVVFATVLALTFPTDTIVRRAVAVAIPPGTAALVFARARLRPWGLQLDDVAVRRPDGSAIAEAERVVLRPSLAGFLRDRSGRPWRAQAAVCGGTLDAALDRDADGDFVTLTWKDVDVGACPSLPLADRGLTGRAEGTARVRLSPRGGDGQIALRAASWHVLPAIRLRLVPASLRWALADGSVTVSDLAVDGPDLHIRGAGTVRLADAAEQSQLDLDLTVAPGNEAPPMLRTFIDRLPPGAGAAMPRHLALTGTATMPQIASIE